MVGSSALPKCDHVRTRLELVEIIRPLLHRRPPFGEELGAVDVARLLADNRNDLKHGTTAEDPSLLAGMIFDEAGQPLTPTHATKSGGR